MGMHKPSIGLGERRSYRPCFDAGQIAERASRAGVRRYFAVILLLAAIVPAAVTGICGCESGKEKKNLNQIQEQIGKFRAGEEFRGDSSIYLVNGRPDVAVLGELRSALRRENEPVREQICHLLADMGKRADPLYAKGGELIRDRSVISILIEEGLSRQTSARDICIEYLQGCVPASSLKEFGKQLADNLKVWPNTRLLLAIAKAKPPEAAETVDSLMKIPGWAQKPATMIAAAALGNKDIEDGFIRRFKEATDPKEKAEAARNLGFIGTPAALEALAGGMRTGLVLEMPGVSMRSVRIFVIEGLRYNFPDSTFLYSNAVRSDKDYEVIEKFCEETFGTRWREERPPFLWIQGFPTGAPPGK